MFFINTEITGLAAILLSGLLASVLAYYINKRALKIWGDEAVTYGAPLVEEILKTFISIALGANILFTHMTFGAVEAIYDFSGHPGARGGTAALVGFVSHGVFGVVTAVVSGYFKSTYMGVAAAVLFHMAWNYTVMNLL